MFRLGNVLNWYVKQLEALPGLPERIERALAMRLEKGLGHVLERLPEPLVAALLRQVNPPRKPRHFDAQAFQERFYEAFRESAQGAAFGQRPSHPPSPSPAVPDYYALLGLSRNASAKQVKRAFRQQAMQCHPDRHPDDTDAASRFQAIHEAYHVLADAERRARYDAGYG